VSKIRKIKWIIIGISLLVFFSSLTQICFCYDKNTCLFGISLFGDGWLGLIFDGQISWLANPLLIISWFSFQRYPKVSLIFSVFSSVLAFSFLLVHKIIIDEGGNMHYITSINIGYWLWILSILTILIGNLVVYIKFNKLIMNQEENH
jgi:hypothetical protein